MKGSCALIVVIWVLPEGHFWVASVLGKDPEAAWAGDELVMRNVVSNSVLQAWRGLFPPQQQFPAPRSHHPAGFARSNLTSFSWEHCGKVPLCLGTSCWWGASQQQFCRVYLRMGYPELTCGIKNLLCLPRPSAGSSAQLWGWVCWCCWGEEQVLHPGASHPAGWSIAASPIATLFFFFFSN